MEHLLLKAATTVATDEGVFTAVISSASVDREKDVVSPAGMVRALHKWAALGKRIPLAWNHSTAAADQIGYIDPASARVQGSEVVASGWVDQTSDVGREAWRSVKAGTLGFSFGYLIPDGGATKRKGGGRDINELDVFEITATGTPMNNDTRVLGWKGIKAAGTVGPAARHHLENLIKYYMSKPHPFTCLVPETPIDAPRDHERHPDGIPMHDLRVDDLVWSFNLERQVFELARVEWAGPTRRNAAMVRVTLDNGCAVLATPDHRFLLRDGNWREAGQLCKGDSLMPLYRTFTPRVRLSPEDGAGWHDEHRTVLDTAFGDDRAGLHAHHVDERYSNTHPTNFELLTSAEHRKRHVQTIQERFENCGHVRRCCDCETEFAPRNAKHKRCDECREWRGYSRRPRIVACPTCGQEFERQSARHTYCSDICQRNRQSDEYPVGTVRTCAHCVEPFVKRSGVQKFCTKGCRLASYATEPLPLREGVNHKVASVEHLAERRDMWDVQVEGNHNFVVHGVVLHNSCVQDNSKRFGPEGADRVCATLKDIGAGTTRWRHGGNHGKAVPPSDEDMQGMCQALYDAASGDLEALLEMWQEYAHSNGDGDVMPSTGKAAMQALRRRADAEALEFVSGEQRPRSEVERDEMRVEMDELREEVTGYKSRFDEAQAELQKAHEALEAKAVDAKTLRRAADSLVAERATDGAQGDMRGEVDELRSELEGYKAQLQESQAALREALDAKSVDARTLRRAADSLAVERATDGVRDEMRAELDALRGELDGYKSRLEKSQTALREALDAKSVDAKTLRRAADALTFEQTAGVKADATDPAEDEDDPAELLGQMMSLAQDFIDDEDDPADVRAMRQVMTLLLQLQGAEAEEDAGKSVKATWSTSYVNGLPDSAFLYIASGGSKDDEGKTTPRSLRYFPVRDANGTVDQDHVRNALSRIPQSNLPQNVKDSCTAKARKLLDSSKSAVPAVRTGSSPVDPLRRLADAVALEYASDGESLRKPPRQKVAPKPTPEVPLDELRRRTRDEMLIALSGVEDP